MATVEGRPIYEEDLLPLVQAQLRQLHNREYAIKTRALDALIDQKLVESEAEKKGVGKEQLLRQEVEANVADPTEEEIQALYPTQRDRLDQPFDEIREQVSRRLKQAKIENARQEYLRALRERADVTILLHPIRTEVSFDPSRVRGNPAAPVTIVEFSDFQCPHCQRAHHTLSELLAKYGDRMRLAFRDFPLRKMHPWAQTAAEAARCAGEQGKFWEYHDLLFSDEAKLDAAGLAENARNLGVNIAQFDSCMAGGSYRKQIEDDIQAGRMAGVAGTPAFFVNGIFLSGAQSMSAFEKLIDGELAARQAGKQP